jgi:hypothetical protein
MSRKEKTMLSRILQTGALGALLLWGGNALAADDAGYVLLEKLTTQFQQIGPHTGPDGAQLEAALNEMMASAKRAKAEARIDQEFFDRYVRVVRVVRALTLPDPEGILYPLLEKEIRAFVDDVLGPQATRAPGTSPMAEIALAIKKELDSLKLKLDQRK